MTTTTVTRFVITHLDQNGNRALAQAAQGRFTFDTAQAAQQALDTVLQNNSTKRLSEVFGLPLRVLPVECWAGHHDPVRTVF